MGSGQSPDNRLEHRLYLMQLNEANLSGWCPLLRMHKLGVRKGEEVPQQAGGQVVVRAPQEPH